MDLVLSLFPGIDLLGIGFERRGFCVVRGPDIISGQDIRNFHPPMNKFDGVIGGSPCQDFSKARRKPPTGYGLEMLYEFIRVVTEAQPHWFLLENVPSIPDIHIENYSIQRLDMNALECGLQQNRLRHFQYGSKYGYVISPIRKRINRDNIQRTCLASEGNNNSRRNWQDFCVLQGLEPTFDLPGISIRNKYRAVGNGVPVPMAEQLAEAIKNPIDHVNGLCGCGCGRLIAGRQTYATAACRKRIQRKRERDSAGINSLS
jgi:DNA (cytosine-5)-methyltransferase 1